MSHPTAPRSVRTASKLDLAIITSMAAMTIFVLAQQLNAAPAPAFAGTGTGTGTVSAQQA